MRIFSLTGMTFCHSPLLLSGCGGEVLSPEDRIREMLSAGEKAFEGRSVSEVGRFLSEQYLDDTGRQRGQLQKLLAGYFLTHQSIHLLMQINRIEFTGESTAETTLFVALAGRPANSVTQLISIRAESESQGGAG
ncbi:MAG: hypothetical protein V3U62_10060 [Sedimenticolaceae bacterium]